MSTPTVPERTERAADKGVEPMARSITEVRQLGIWNLEFVITLSRHGGNVWLQPDRDHAFQIANSEFLILLRRQLPHPCQRAGVDGRDDAPGEFLDVFSCE